MALSALLLLPLAAGAAAPDADVLDPNVTRFTAGGPTGSRAAAAGVELLPDVAAPAVFATYAGLDLHLPSDETLFVGYHEASFTDALALQPVGDAVANENRTKFSAPTESQDGPAYVVLSSRGRRQAATSAVDLVLRDDVPVRSLVSGRVVGIRPYALYGRYPDTRIEIEPEGQPGLRLVVIHVRDVVVRPGDVVVAGETVLAESANRFPFASHVDRYFEQDRWPHVHVELKPAGSVRPGDDGYGDG